MKKYIFLSTFIFAIVVFLVHFFIVKTAVYGDGRYYYAYLPTFFIEHSFNFSQSFHYYGLPFLFSPTHFLQNPHTIGPAIVWSIPYLSSFYIFFLFGNTNPYNTFLQIPVGIWNISLVFLGLFFVFKTLKKYFSQKIAYSTTLTLFFSTNLFFYGAIDVLNSHSTSFFFAALFVYLWTSKISIKHSLLLGFSLGMLMLSRTQDIIFILLPLATLLEKKFSYVFYFAITLAVTLLILVPQFLLWHVLWGGWLKSPYLYGVTFNFLTPNILGVLFNVYNGFFLWTPVAVLAITGLVVFSKKQKIIGMPFLLVFLMTLYFIAAFEIWWGGASFSSRYLISTLPLLAFGLATFYKRLMSAKKQIIVSFFFSLLNILLILYFLIKN